MKRWRKILVASAILFFVLVFYFGAYYVLEWKMHPGKIRSYSNDPFAGAEDDTGDRFLLALFAPAVRLDEAHERWRWAHIDGMWGDSKFRVKIEGGVIKVIANSIGYKIAEKTNLVRNQMFGLESDDTHVSLVRGKNSIRIYSRRDGRAVYLNRNW